jgi:hypothetical protein
MQLHCLAEPKLERESIVYNAFVKSSSLTRAFILNLGGEKEWSLRVRV